MYSFDVPFSKRLVQCICAITWCLFSGGPIFGFAALKPVLINERVYEYLCDETTHLVIEGKEVVSKCTDQDLKLNMMFTVGAVVTNVSALLIGRVLDVYGPRVCGLVGAGFLYLACFIFIFAKSLPAWFDPYLFGYAALALGGPFAYISSFQLSNSFPEKSGTILALITGAFDASSALFLIYRILYNSSGASFTLESFFTLYLLVPTFITVVEFLVMPAESYQTSPDSVLCVNDEENVSHLSPVNSAGHPQHSLSSGQEIRETSPLLASSHHRHDSIGDALKQPYELEGEEFLMEHTGGVFGILHGYTASAQIYTWWFGLICIFSTIQMLRLNYFVATINTQYQYIFGSIEKAENLNSFFDIALPLGGLISIPFIGLFLDNFSTVIVLTGLLAISLAIGILGFVSNYALAVIGVCMFVAYRPLFYTTISDFCAKVFGFETFGTVYGTIIMLSGIFNFSQSWLDKLTHTTFRMNPLPVNVALVVVTAISGVITVVYVHDQAKKFNASKKVPVRG
ncbi:uncharacterized protein SPAPADRAFT_66821 [Spathaspora passalidarum NRRL Y-27907]|uniref:Protein FMP42 n=1 Tax=Spathaspora passalidarum (strain NRRL Y-27907 / 11-Y1) TaxID=619300 RepID=G3APK0_SPAPN|nr:uncharacterized protein SPAPADRAFT_66821 [Spathaspora passalidarum NRRL Y-27907]EGW32171.1 hypothetical protein SPAPADRAFT_66821 [Spathaspora passalidarum NRRL Y-27907]